MMPTPSPDVNPMARAGVVDAHFHAFPRVSSGVEGARYVPGYAAPLQDWRAAVRPHGVTRGVLVQPSFLGVDNTHLLDLLGAFPEELRAVAVVAPDVDSETLCHMDAQGVRGIRLNLAGQSPRLGPGHLRLLERLLELDWHVQIHTEPGRMTEVLEQIPPELIVVVDHFGKPAAVDELGRLSASQADRLHVKLSAPYRLAPGASALQLANRWRDLVGTKRLVWGSDWPCTAHEQERPRSASPAWIAEWLPSAEEREDVFRRNAERLYRF